MGMTVTRHGTGLDMMHVMSNGALRLEIRSGLDARIASIRHVTTGRELLKQDCPHPYAASTYPYGVSVWVKAGDALDVNSGVLNRTLLPYEYSVSRRPQVTQDDRSTSYTAIHEAAGIRLEKRYILPCSGSQFSMAVKLTNISRAPLRLQLELPLSWHSGSTRPKQKFIIPAFSGVDCTEVPIYDVVEIESFVLAEPWAAIIDDLESAELLMTLAGVEKVSRLYYGTHGILCLYSPIADLAPQGTIETVQTLYYLPNLMPEAVPKDIAAMHTRAQMGPLRSYTNYVASTLSHWDTLLPRPRQTIRELGTCPVALGSLIAPASLAEEARLFQQQGAKAFPDSAGGRPIRLVEGLEDQPREAYELVITPTGVTITGGPHGIWNGCQTLLDLLKPEQGMLQAPCGRIADAPDMPLRGVILFPDGPEWDVCLETYALHALARLKLNTVAFPITAHLVHDDALWGEQATTNPVALPLSRLADLCTRLRQMHIEVLPTCGFTPSRDFTDAITAQNDARLERLIAACQPQRLTLRFQQLGQALFPLAHRLTQAASEIPPVFDGQLLISPDDAESVAFLKLIHRYYQFLHERGVQMVLGTDVIEDVRMHQCPPLVEHAQRLLDQLPRGLILHDVSNDADSYYRQYLHASQSSIIGSPIPMPRQIRRYGQALARDGGLGMLTWGSDLSPEACGAVEGVILSAVYGWHAEGPEIDVARVLMWERINWIADRRWA